MGELLVCDLCGCDVKYRCPRCDTRSCSMPCVQKHKQISGCDGVRKNINYIPINKFTELDLVQDFRILESATATIDKCQRDKLKRSSNHRIDGIMAPRISFKRRKLEQEAFRRGVQVKFLPPHFARRQANQSHFRSREKVLRWDVELKLPHAQNKSMKLECVPDTTQLWKLLAPLMEPGLSEDKLGFTEPEIGLSVEDIDAYQSMGYGGVIVLLRTETLMKRRRDAVTEENKNARVDRYTELDLKRSLRHNIRGHILVEHPCLEVVRKDEACNYRDQGFVDMMPIPLPHERVDNADDTEHQEDSHHHDIQEENEEEVVDSEADAYRKYYDFYFNYYRKKYTPPTNINDTSKRGDGKSNTEKGSEEGLPSAMSQLASKLLSTVVSQEQKQQYKVLNDSHNDTKINKTKQNVELNEKNAEKARRIGDEIRESLLKDERTTESGGAQKDVALGGSVGGLPGLSCYSDSDEEL